MIRLVALDVDGTLVGRDNVIRARVRSEIERVHAAGVAACLVTGRMYQSALPFARDLQMNAPIICYQGAAIVDPTTDVVLFDMPLPNAEVLDVVRLARADGVHLQLYRNDNYYCEARNRFSDLYAQISGVEPVIVPSLAETFATSDATKAVVISDAMVAERYAGRVKERLGDRAYVTRSYPEFVEIVSPLVDKGQALEFVAARLGICMDDVMAIGDSWNDEPLLRAARVSVAMGSAPLELRSIADAVVGDAEHDGVAEALERYVLS